MVWQASVYVGWLAVSATVALLVTGLAWRHRDRAGGVWLALLMLAVATWSAAYAVGVASTLLGTKLLMTQLAYLGIVLIPVFWLFFALEVTGRTNPLATDTVFIRLIFGQSSSRYTSRRALGLLFAVPAITLGFAWTNTYHGMIWETTTLAEIDAIVVLTVTYGPWFWIHATYSYLLLVAGTVLLLGLLIRADHVNHYHVGVILLAVIIPWAANGAHISGLNPYQAIDPTPLAFTLSGLLLLGVIVRYRLFDVLPVAREVARDSVVDSLADPVIVLDAQDRIIDHNPAARPLLESAASDAIGLPLDQANPALAKAARDRSPADDEQATVTLETDGHPRTYDLNVRPIRDAWLNWHILTARTTPRTDDRFEAIVEAAPTPVLLLDPDGRITYANPAIEQTLGFTPSEIEGETATDYVHPDDRDAFLIAIGEAQSATPVVHAYRHRTPDDGWQSIETRLLDRTSDPAVNGVIAYYPENPA